MKEKREKGQSHLDNMEFGTKETLAKKKAIRAIDWIGSHLTVADWALWSETVSSLALDGIKEFDEYRQTMLRLRGVGTPPGAVYVIRLARLFGWNE